MTISRRELLQGLSLGIGSSLLLPVLHQLKLRAAGKMRAPLRFVFVLQSNGFQPWAAQPAGVELTDAGPDKVVDLPLADYKLPADLAPLKPHLRRVTILQHLSGRHTRPYHSAFHSALSGAARANMSVRTPSAMSIDAAVARRHPGVVPIVNVGVTCESKRKLRVDEHGREAICSAWGADRPMFTQTRPDQVYAALFGDIARKSIADGGKLLDQVVDEVKRVEGELAAEERAQFERYLDAFEALDAQRLGLRELAKIDREKLAARPTDEAVGHIESNRLAAMFELASAALVGGLTHVVTICSGMCDPNGNYEGMGLDIPIHPLGHEVDVGDRPWKEVYTLLRQEHIGHIAKLVAQLESIPEGAGTMMDNTLIVYTSDAAETHHSNGDQWPFVLVGDLGRRLRAGRYIDYPGIGKPGNRVINALYCTIDHAAGSMGEEFNMDEELRKLDSGNPLEELLG